MIKLNHINLVVNNVAEAIVFFETYFNFRCKEVKGNHIIGVLEGADGFSLVLMQAKEGIGHYPEAFHIGFMMSAKEEVEDIYKKLKEGNITLGSEPKQIRDSFGFYFQFDSIMIEVGYYN